MKRDSASNAVDKVMLPASPDAKEGAGRAAMTDVSGQIQRDLSFMSFLEEPAWMLKLSISQSALETMEGESQASSAAEQDKRRGARTEKSGEDTKPATDTATGNTQQPPPADSGKDLKDARDMWVIDARQLPLSDIKALHNLGQLVPTPMTPINNFSPSLLEQVPQGYYKSLGVSAGLQDLLDRAYKTQRAIRIDLTDTASIILRMGRDGRVSAEFLPSDQAADLYFRQNLQELKSRLESKQLPYGELLVRDWKQQDDPREKRR